LSETGPPPRLRFTEVETETDGESRKGLAVLVLCTSEVGAGPTDPHDRARRSCFVYVVIGALA